MRIKWMPIDLILYVRVSSVLLILASWAGFPPNRRRYRRHWASVIDIPELILARWLLALGQHSG
jgi:hypothetical protein